MRLLSQICAAVCAMTVLFCAHTARAASAAPRKLLRLISMSSCYPTGGAAIYSKEPDRSPVFLILGFDLAGCVMKSQNSFSRAGDAGCRTRRATHDPAVDRIAATEFARAPPSSRC